MCSRIATQATQAGRNIFGTNFDYFDVVALLLQHAPYLCQELLGKRGCHLFIRNEENMHYAYCELRSGSVNHVGRLQEAPHTVPGR